MRHLKETLTRGIKKEYIKRRRENETLEGYTNMNTLKGETERIH